MKKLKKSSFFFFETLKLRPIFLYGNVFCFFNSFINIFSLFNHFKAFVSKFNLFLFILSSAFVTFFFKLPFFFFIKPFTFLITSFSFGNFLIFFKHFQEDIDIFNVFPVALCFNSFFFNFHSFSVFDFVVNLFYRFTFMILMFFFSKFLIFLNMYMFFFLGLYFNIF